jgi:AcrR family transcriptional regulator
VTAQVSAGGYGERVTREAAARAGRKRFLTREMVVRAGIAVVEAEGLEAVTIRRVATELGAAPMALYRHVADKRELLLAMLEEMALGIPAPRTEGEPVERLVGGLLLLHDYLAEHSWLVEVLQRGEMFAPRSVEHFDHLLGVLASTGLDPDEALAAYSMLWWYLIGHLSSRVTATPERAESRRALAAMAPLERLPYASAAFARLDAFDHTATFENGLRVFVAALLAR